MNYKKMIRYEVPCMDGIFTSTHDMSKIDKDKLMDLVDYFNMNLKVPKKGLLFDFYDCECYFTKRGEEEFKEGIDELVALINEAGYEVRRKVIKLPMTREEAKYQELLVYEDPHQCVLNKDNTWFEDIDEIDTTYIVNSNLRVCL